VAGVGLGHDACSRKCGASTWVTISPDRGGHGRARQGRAWCRHDVLTAGLTCLLPRLGCCKKGEPCLLHLYSLMTYTAAAAAADGRLLLLGRLLRAVTLPVSAAAAAAAAAAASIYQRCQWGLLIICSCRDPRLTTAAAAAAVVAFLCIVNAFLFEDSNCWPPHDPAAACVLLQQLRDSFPVPLSPRCRGLTVAAAEAHTHAGSGEGKWSNCCKRHAVDAHPNTSQLTSLVVSATDTGLYILCCIDTCQACSEHVCVLCVPCAGSTRHTQQCSTTDSTCGAALQARGTIAAASKGLNCEHLHTRHTCTTTTSPRTSTPPD
jgi:hypothetical protein